LGDFVIGQFEDAADEISSIAELPDYQIAE